MPTIQPVQDHFYSIRIREWLLQLLEIGPSYGHFAEPSKSVIVVKEQHLEETKIIFSDLQVEVAPPSRFLGGCIGNKECIERYVQSKVDCGSKASSN